MIARSREIRTLVPLLLALIVTSCGEQPASYRTRVKQSALNAPVKCQAPKDQPTFSLTPELSPKALALDEWATAQLRERVPDFVTFNVTKRTKSFNGLHLDYELLADGIPLCNVTTRAHSVQDRQFIMGGPAAGFKEGLITQNIWQPVATSLTALRNQIGNHTLDRDIRINDATRCYLVQEQELHAAWQSRLTIAGVPYLAVLNGSSIYRLEKRSFGATGIGHKFQVAKSIFITIAALRFIKLQQQPSRFACILMHLCKCSRYCV